MPERVQLSRAKGFKLPASAIMVSRPTIWGNPYPVKVWGLDLSMTLFGESARGFWSPRHVEHLSDADVAIIYRAHSDFGRRFHLRFGCGAVEAARSLLRGRDVACWCKADERCHGDTWLEIANEGFSPQQRGTGNG